MPVQVDGNKTAKCKVWDTPGQKRFRNDDASCYKGCHGAILVFDITNQDSFNSLGELHDEVKINVGVDTPLCILGTKCDLAGQREVSQEDAIAFAAARGTQYYEVSAKNNIKVADPFYHLVGTNVNLLSSS